MRRLRQRLASERGIALALALGIITVLSISVTTAIYYTSTNARSSNVSKAGQVAYALAEAGINNAMSVLLLPTNNALDKYVFCADSASLPTLPCVNTNTYDGGTVQWYGTLNQNVGAGTASWTLTSTGYVRNPTGNTVTKVKKTIKATIPVIPTTSQPLNNPSWNYIYSRQALTGQAFNGCDMTIQNSVNVTAPLYVLGNLCLQNQAKISKGPLFIKGSLTMNQAANQIGAAGADISQAHIGGGCKYQNQASHNPCVYGSGGNPTNADNVWASILDNNVSTVTSPPTVDWNGWYLNASPGPYYPCQTVSGTPPTFDSPVASASDSDASKLTYKNNNAGLINLTPASSYTCKNVNGELSWNAPTNTLTVNGTMFIDGSVYVNNGSLNKYQGQATLHISGTLLIKNSKFCAISSTIANGSCTTTGWDSTKDLLCFVVNGNGSTGSPDNQVVSGDSVQLVSGYMMGAIYATNAIDIDTTSLVDGPLDGSTVKLGQSSTSTFSGFTFVPVGMPGENTIYAVAQTPQIIG